MARPAAKEDARIRKLRESLRRASEQGMLRITLGQSAMCKLLGIQAATLRDWLDDPDVDASLAFNRGGNGVEYEFNPIATIWVLIRYFERLRDERTDKNRKIRQMVSGDKIADAPDDMDIKDVREAMQLHLQILANEKESGLLVSAAESERRFNDFVLALRDACLSAPQKLDPTNNWTPEFRENFDNALAELLVLFQQAGREALSASDVAIPPRHDASAAARPRRRTAGKAG
jgi:hypothetical protein